MENSISLYYKNQILEASVRLAIRNARPVVERPRKPKKKKVANLQRQVALPPIDWKSLQANDDTHRG